MAQVPYDPTSSVAPKLRASLLALAVALTAPAYAQSPPQVQSLGNQDLFPVIPDGNVNAGTKYYTLPTLTQSLAAVNNHSFNVADYGASSFASAAINNQAFANAFSDAAAINGSVHIPCQPNAYNLTQNITATILPKGAIAIEGDGHECVQLNFTGVNGITLTKTDQFGSVLAHDFTITTTDTTGVYKAFTLTNPNAVTYTPSSLFGQDVIRNVFYRGADAYSANLDYWGVGLNIVNDSYISVDAGGYWGGFQSGVYKGLASSIQGLVSPASYAVVLNLNSFQVQNCDTGLLYGDYVQGVTITGGSNFSQCNYAVNSLASYVGVPDALTIADSQFATFKIGVNAPLIPELLVHHNAIILLGSNSTVALTNATTSSANSPMLIAASPAYIQITNSGSNPVSFATGGSGITATVGNTGSGAGTVAANSTFNFKAANGATYLAVIASGGASAVTINQLTSQGIVFGQLGYTIDDNFIHTTSGVAFGIGLNETYGSFVGGSVHHNTMYALSTAIDMSAVAATLPTPDVAVTLIENNPVSSNTVNYWIDDPALTGVTIHHTGSLTAATALGAHPVMPACANAYAGATFTIIDQSTTTFGAAVNATSGGGFGTNNWGTALCGSNGYTFH